MRVKEKTSENCCVIQRVQHKATNELRTRGVIRIGNYKGKPECKGV